MDGANLRATAVPARGRRPRGSVRISVGLLALILALAAPILAVHALVPPTSALFSAQANALTVTVPPSVPACTEHSPGDGTTQDTSTPDKPGECDGVTSDPTPGGGD
ncbi:MAG: hypothetical protein M0T72_01075 [Candidatus Dormibacteraeota bacterium]|nr:hypothetical protein [Candidatus Dormibacteraeota bacterium]